MTSQFGYAISVGQIEQATLALMEEWFPSYLRHIERLRNWQSDQLPTPVNYSRRSDFDYEPGELIPKVVLISPGLFEQPELETTEEGRSVYKATWQISTGILISAPTELLAIDMAGMYAAALRLMVISHQDLDVEDLGITYTTWLDEAYDDFPVENQHYMFRGARVDFGVEVESAVTRWETPDSPSEADIEVPEVEEVITDIKRTDHDYVATFVNIPD